MPGKKNIPVIDLDRLEEENRRFEEQRRRRASKSVGPDPSREELMPQASLDLDKLSAEMEAEPRREEDPREAVYRRLARVVGMARALDQEMERLQRDLVAMEN